MLAYFLEPKIIPTMQNPRTGYLEPLPCRVCYEMGLRHRTGRVLVSHQTDSARFFLKH